MENPASNPYVSIFDKPRRKMKWKTQTYQTVTTAHLNPQNQGQNYYTVVEENICGR